MSTAIATIPDIPSYLQVGSEAARARNLAAMGGIKAGGFPRISIGGAKFHMIDGDDKILLTDPNNPELPAMQLEVAVVGFNSGISKTYYKGKWQEGDSDEPDCSSDDGITPDPHVATPQCTNCAGCPQNAWGSKVSEQGKQIKACSDNKRLVILPVADLDESKAIAFTITPASLKPWAEYVRLLDSKGVEISTCVTKIQFDPTVTFPKLQFKFGRYLTPEELAIVRERETEDDVRLIASPRKSAPQAPRAAAPAAPAQPAAPAPAPTAPVASAAQAASPAAEPPKPTDPFEGLPPHVKLAVDGAGGIDSDAGKDVYATLAGKPAPSIVAAPPEPPKPADPFEGLPPHVKRAVDGAGGIDSDAGKTVYATLAGKPAPGAVAQAATIEAPAATPAKRRGRPAAKPADTAPAAVPAAPAPAQPAAPVQSFATAPAGDLDGDLDALLRNAMNTPTA